VNYLKNLFGQLSNVHSVSLSHYKLLKIFGNDVQSFLHNQCTNNIKDLQEGIFQTNSMLSNKGMVECVFLLWQISDVEFYALVEESSLDSTLERFNRYLISEDVEIETVSNKYSFLIGSQKHQGIEGIFMGERGYLTLEEHKDELSLEDIKLFKVLSGYPVMSVDFIKPTLMNNSTLIYYAYDNKKGCFPGNETISKIESRKGAGFKDSLLYLENVFHFNVGDAIRVEGRKIGTIKDGVSLESETYLVVDLLREYRINLKKIKPDEFESDVVIYELPVYDTNEKPQYFYDYGVELFQAGDDELALDYFKLALKFKPDFADAYESLAVLLGRLERFEEAVKILNELLEVDKKSVMAHTNLSMFHMKLGNIETAEEHKSQATFNSFEKFGEEAQIKKAKEEKDKQDQAQLIEREKMFIQVLEIDAQDPLANFGLGEISFKRKEFEKALKHLEIVINADKNYSVAYLLLSKVLIAKGDNDQAKETLNLGIEVAAKNGDLMPANEMQRILLNL